MILSVTDIKIENSSNKIVKTSYQKIRKSVKSEIQDNVPQISKILENHIKI